jgi:SAM-dependent methyltransferase
LPKSKKNHWNQALRETLAHPLTRGLDLDDPATTERRRQIIKSKYLLKRVYDQWYAMIQAGLDENGPILELGSGGGFMSESINGLITSEVFFSKHVAVIANATALPFARASLRAIVMVEVLHHIPDVRRFFREAEVCLHTGGVVLMIEPWVSGWSKLIWGKLHHEPFDWNRPEWSFPSTGPLSSANGALPWILVERDRAVFERDFPQFEIATVRPIMPFQYLVSGGVSMRSLAPGWSYHFWRLLEATLRPWMGDWGMYAFIALRKRAPTSES